MASPGPYWKGVLSDITTGVSWEYDQTPSEDDPEAGTPSRTWPKSGVSTTHCSMKRRKPWAGTGEF